MMETGRKDISPLGSRGERKRRLGQGPLISVGSNDGDHSSLTAVGNSALLGRLYTWNGAYSVSVSGDETRVTLAHGGVESTRSRRSRRHRNNHRHWNTTPPDRNDKHENHPQSEAAAATTIVELLRHSRRDSNVMPSDSTKIYRHLQSSDDSIGKQQPPHLLQVACLFLPILAGAFCYWTKRRARKVATVLGHDSACATAAAAAAAAGTAGRDGTDESAEGHYRRWYDGPAGGSNTNINVDDEVDEYCAWYAGAGHTSNGVASWNPDGSHSPGGDRVNNSFGSANADGTYSSQAMALEEAMGRQLEPRTVLWIKGGPRGDPRNISGDIELAKRTSSMSPPSAPQTAAVESAWRPIQDLYTLDAMQGSGLDLSPSGHDSSYFADPCTDACSIVGSSIAGIHMPRFAPMTMDRGDHLRISCRSATPSPTGGADGGDSGTGTKDTAFRREN